MCTTISGMTKNATKATGTAKSIHVQNQLVQQVFKTKVLHQYLAPSQATSP